LERKYYKLAIDEFLERKISLVKKKREKVEDILTLDKIYIDVLSSLSLT